MDKAKIEVEIANLMGLCHAFVPANSTGLMKENSMSTTAVIRFNNPNQKRSAFRSFSVTMNSILSILVLTKLIIVIL